MRVMLVDDAALFREGLAALLGAVGVEVVGQAANAEDGLALAMTLRPDVVIMDIRMPPTFGDEGLLAARRLKDRHPDLGVLVLSAHVMVTSAARLLDGQTNGVGYLLKDRVDDIAELEDALARVRNGELVIDSDVVKVLLRRRRNADVIARLSEREQEIIRLMAEGRSNAGIAQHTNLAVKTVEKNVASIFAKINLASSGDDNRRVLAVLAWLRAGGV